MSGLRGLTLLTLVCGLLAWPVTGYAQEATISGTVKDSTKYRKFCLLAAAAC